jgi:hypothetical protein
MEKSTSTTSSRSQRQGGKENFLLKTANSIREKMNEFHEKTLNGRSRKIKLYSEQKKFNVSKSEPSSDEEQGMSDASSGEKKNQF